VDWFAFGLPMEGEQAGLPRVGQFARRDVPRCRLAETIGEVRGRAQAAGWNLSVVVNEEDVVLGLVRDRELDADPSAAAEEVMRPGPATYRPDVLVSDAAERLKRRSVKGILVTLPDGRLIGWLRREDAEREHSRPQ
jgi:CBS domain-containing protein